MMKPSSILAVLLLAIACGAAKPETKPNVYESSAPARPAGQLDRIVFAKLSSLGIEPVLCSDAVFVRRAYLDVIGTLPSAKEAREFIDDPDTKNKRRLLIDRLLERPEFADYWAMKWGDVLRIKAEFPVNLWPNAAQAYSRWVHASLVENKPYDKFVREMLTSSGSNFRVGPVNFYRAIQNKTPEGIADAVALTCMGARADTWPKERLAGMTVFFSQIGYKPTSEWKEEWVFWDPLHSAAVPGNSAPGQAAIKPPGPAPTPATGPTTAPAPDGASQVSTAPPAAAGPLVAVFPDGTKVKLSPDRDPREVFADWLITPKNPWFTRAIVNRVWAWLLGRGIIHEADDIRDDNPPSDPKLLAFLEKELIDSHYDLKHLYRLILNSSTYQFSAMPLPGKKGAEAPFARYRVRRLDGEVLIDAINEITGTTDLYTSPIPEPFTYIPKDMPAIAIADGSITSPFLTLFGRSARATGMANERSGKATPSQWLHMLNSSHIQRKLEQGPNLKAILDSGRKPGEIVEELYLTILSRRPTPEEVKNVEQYGVPAATSQPFKSGKPTSPGKYTKPGKRVKPVKYSKSGPPASPGKPNKSTSSNKNTKSGKPTGSGKSGKPNKSTSSNKNTKSGKPTGSGKYGKTGKPTSPGKYSKPGKYSRPLAFKRRDQWIDIAWALINSTEFLYRH